LANITKFSKAIIDQISPLLKGGTVMQGFDQMFDTQSNLPHRYIATVLATMTNLKISDLIAPKNSRFRRLVLGMIAARVLDPTSKPATSSLLNSNTATTILMKN